MHNELRSKKADEWANSTGAEECERMRMVLAQRSGDLPQRGLAPIMVVVKSYKYGHGQVPTKGLFASQRFALGAIFVYQLALLYRFEHHLDLCVGLKAILKAA